METGGADVAIVRDRARPPGVGSAIIHQGATAGYFLLSWWDNDNELPMRVFVREGERWRPARDSELFCVWDLEIIWHEREAFVRSMLTRGGGGVEAYLIDVALEVR